MPAAANAAGHRRSVLILYPMPDRNKRQHRPAHYHNRGDRQGHDRPRPPSRKVDHDKRDGRNDNQIHVPVLDQGDGLMGHDHRRVIAIDGPGAAGKSTVADELARHLGAMLFDTGAIYRAVTLAARRLGIEVSDADALTELARRTPISLRPASIDDGRQVDVLLDGEDVTWEIRTPDIDSNVSAVSAHQGVRSALLHTQRAIADDALVVMVGRDIGTVVVPDAGVKIFLNASAAERARRRLVDLRAKGIDATFDSVLADLQARDEYDSSRKVAPLRAADDAVVIDSDGRTVQEIVREIESLAEARWAASVAKA
jgi:cytidylate kinase